jgi:hypothetical protein
VSLRRVAARCALALLLAGAAPALAAPLPTAFTYQGRLVEAGQPATGTYALTFRLFDAETGGAQVGPTLVVPGVVVTQGVFTVTLDFGPVSWTQARWLDVTVGATLLSPRQPVTPTPAALHAASAASAPFSGLTGVPSGLADGDDVGLTSVPWSIVQNRPAGLDDGDNDTTYTAGTGLALTGTTFSAKGTPLANLVTVAKSGGDFTTIQAAVDSITTAGVGTPWLVYIAPGTYTERVVLKDYVSLRGAGPGITVISAPNGGSGPATVSGANGSTVSYLTIEANGFGGARVVGYYTGTAAVDTTLDHVWISVTDASSMAAVEARGVVLDVRDSQLRSTGFGGQTAIGLDHYEGTVRLVQSDILVSATTVGGQAILTSGYQVHVEGGRLDAFSSNSTGLSVHGVLIYAGEVFLNGVRIRSGGGQQAIGVKAGALLGGVVLVDADVQASGGGQPAVGLAGPGIIQVRNSRISAAVAADPDGGSIRAAHSMIDGTLAAPITCIGAYDAAFAARTCP